MPSRIIKESINESRGLTSCSFFAQDLYKRLITYADDYGRFNADPQIMVARLYPRELSVITQDDLIDGLVELVGVGKIGFYTSAPRHEVYGAFPNWAEHQRLRESKKKAPDPTDTAVNDWYYRRFIPLDMKAAIIERDGFKCQICGKHIAESIDARKVAKMGTGMYHIDHIVPCNQGGRATMENLRLTCPTCNLKRKRMFSYDEILEFAESCGNSRQTAANCKILRPESESNPNTNPNPTLTTLTRTREEETAFGTVTVDPLIIKVQKELNGLTDTHYSILNQYRQELGDDLVSLAIDNAVAQGVRKWAYVERILTSWQEKGVKTVGDAKAEDEKHRKATEPDKPKKTVTAQRFPQRQYDGKQLEDEYRDDFLKYAGVQ